MSALGAFCTHLVDFFADLAETYPEEKDIHMAAQALKLMKQANPRLMHSFFIFILVMSICAPQPPPPIVSA